MKVLVAGSETTGAFTDRLKVFKENTNLKNLSIQSTFLWMLSIYTDLIHSLNMTLDDTKYES